MRLPGSSDRVLKLDLGGLEWHLHGAEGFGSASPALLDLLEIARVVYEFDHRQPKRTTGARVKQVRVRMPVRVPSRWTTAAKSELCALLRVQGNAEWIFEFSKRNGSGAEADVVFGSRARRAAGSVAPRVKAVVLFSGGLDSTSGLATLAGQAEKTLLVGYYANNRSKQLHIAGKLGFERFVQVGSDWPMSKLPGRAGGQFVYRSFLFLSLAAVFADATRASSLLQFENGPLALAVPPTDIYRITRHAHPLVHQHMARLFQSITGRPLAISNPFVQKTKGEAVAYLRTHLSKPAFKEIVGKTESCWYLNARTIVAGPPRKESGQACGGCVPCLVRRVALGDDDIEAGVDFKSGGVPAARDRVVRVHFEAYSAFAQRLLSRAYGLHDFMEDAPTATRVVLNSAGGASAAAAFDVYRRFAREWTRTFE
jgi:7-cyano-7-deazaguanine synthase in queuosine biosynthesis